MGELTCPNCNVDVDAEELRRSNLCCPTCGHDLSDVEDADDLALDKAADEKDPDAEPAEDELDGKDEEDDDDDEDEEDEE